MKVTVNLSEDDVAKLKALAEKRETTLTQVLRQAIASENYFEQERDKGFKVLLNKGKEFREVVFRP